MYSLYNGLYDQYFSNFRPSFSDESLSYWERSLFQRLCVMFEISGEPEFAANQVQWDMDALYYGLFRIGFLAMFRSRTYGAVFQPATPAGIGMFYQPTGMTINTPYFQIERPLLIGQECEVLKLTPDYMGVWDIVGKYAKELQNMDVAIRQSAINARFAYAIAAPDKKTAESAVAMMERLENGDTAVVYDTRMKQDIEDGTYKVPWQQFDRDLKQNFILPELLECRRTMLEDFYREIGVKTTQKKRERQITQEQEAQDEATFNRRSVWNRCLEQSIERVNALLGLSLSVKYNEPEEVERRVAAHTNTQPVS